ncbi:MAG TPA: DUF1573 domain-containing protein [bacterium]|nr:DUF1573 domain-containing protein [bacterium]
MKRLQWWTVFFLFPAGLHAQPAAVSPIVTPGALLTPSAVASPVVSAANGPKLYCAHPKFDFHNVDEGPDIVHEFHFRNLGKSTLVISEVHTSCGCTAAVEDKKQVPPGGVGTIKATYHTQGRPGHATKIITVTSNDPVNPSFQMQLDMTVIREIDVQPERSYFYGLKHNTSQTNTVNILGKPHKLLHVLSAQAAGGQVTVQLTPLVDKTAHRYGATLSITAPASLPIGEFSDTINVKTDDPKKADLQVPIQGEVIGRVQYSPKTLYFASHQSQPSYVQFTVNPPQGFAIRSVSSVKHLVRPDVKKMTSPDGTDGYSIEVYALQSLPANSDGQDQLVVETNDAEQPKIVISVTLAKQ